MAITRRQSHLLTMSGVAPTSDLRARMSRISLFSSGLPPGPEVPGATGRRGLLTPNRHWRCPMKSNIVGDFANRALSSGDTGWSLSVHSVTAKTYRNLTVVTDSF